MFHTKHPITNIPGSAYAAMLNVLEYLQYVHHL